MQGTYSELRDKAVSQDLIERLTMAVTDVAIEVYTEDASTPNHEKRQEYAVQVAANPRSKAEQMRYAIVYLMADDEDASIRQAVITAWNAFAGIITTAA